MFLLTIEWVSRAPYHLKRYHTVSIFVSLSFSSVRSMRGAPQSVYPVMCILYKCMIANATNVPVDAFAELVSAQPGASLTTWRQKVRCRRLRREPPGLKCGSTTESIHQASPHRSTCPYPRQSRGQADAIRSRPRPRSQSTPPYSRTS